MLRRDFEFDLKTFMPRIIKRSLNFTPFLKYIC